MGSGKTTICKLLAEKLNVNFEDLDEMITVEYGLSINEIFSKYGETTFRSAESNALISSTGNVISCGGGIILDKKNRDYICLLYTSPSPRDVEESRMAASA